MGGWGTMVDRETSPDEGLLKFELKQECNGDVAAGINVTSRKGFTDKMKFDYQAAWEGAQGLGIGHRLVNERVEDKIWVGLIAG